VALLDSEPLAALSSLEPDRLYLFLAGPGEGEGIAVAFPGGGWMLVDGCQTVNRSNPKFPIEEIFKRYRRGRKDRVELMVLTHPHRDHMYGFAELLETLAPVKVGILGKEDPRWILAEEACAHHKVAGKDSPLKESHKRAHAVLRAIESYAEDGTLVGLADGETAFQRETFTVHVRAPDQALFLEKIRQEGAKAFLGAEANCFSLVLEINYERLTVVLGGDLPKTLSGRPVPTGWDRVLHCYPDLSFHHGLKLPHHGSAEALHEELISPMPQRGRAWCVTPYNSSSLPRFGSDDGMRRALQGQSPIMLTALPVSSDHQQKDIVTMSVDEVERMTQALKLKLPSGSLPHRAAHRLEPLDPVWAVAFDSQGTVRGRWRGPCALDVVG